MTVKQISVFLENKTGRLAEFSRILRQNNIDMRALSIAETPDFGILRVIVDDSYKTACILKEAGYVVSITPVLAAAIPDEAGGICDILTVLDESGINVEYTYAFLSRKEKLAYAILRVADNEKAAAALTKNHIRLVTQDELNRF